MGMVTHKMKVYEHNDGSQENNLNFLFPSISPLFKGVENVQNLSEMERK